MSYSLPPTQWRFWNRIGRYHIVKLTIKNKTSQIFLLQGLIFSLFFYFSHLLFTNTLLFCHRIFLVFLCFFLVTHFLTLSTIGGEGVVVVFILGVGQPKNGCGIQESLAIWMAMASSQGILTNSGHCRDGDLWASILRVEQGGEGLGDDLCEEGVGEVALRVEGNVGTV